MRSSKGKWFSLLLVGLMVMSLGLLAGCSSDDKDDSGPTGPTNGGGGGTSGNACYQLCAKVCNMMVQCGAIPTGSCTNTVLNQCADASNANGGNAACQDGLNDPLNCSMF